MWGVVRRHPRCRPGYRARHPGCRPGSRARHPGWRPRQPGCRPPAPEVLVTGTRSWQPRMPRAAPGVPRPAAGFSPPRKFGQPGCRARHPGCRGPAAVSGEMRWRFTSRPYLERISVAISSSPHQARGQRGKFGVPLPGTGRPERHPGPAPEVRARTILKESWQAAWTVHRELRPCPRAGCIPRPPGGGPVAIGLRSWGPPFTPGPGGLNRTNTRHRFLTLYSEYEAGSGATSP